VNKLDVHQNEFMTRIAHDLPYACCLTTPTLLPRHLQYAAGSDSDDPDAPPDSSDDMALAQHLGSATATYSLQLQPNEKVLQVSWQGLQQELKEPRSCAAAVLTTHRIMIVSGDLKLITSAPAGGGALAAVHGITSMCWAGPALLYATVLGEWLELVHCADAGIVCIACVLVQRYRCGDGMVVCSCSNPS
jgi:hypothetical protein